jgi:hypothetical protein
VDNGIVTSSGNLSSAQPSANALYSQINSASYKSNGIVNQTVWLKGFLAPARTSSYKLTIVTNGVAELYLSTDSTSSNKLRIAFTPTNTSGIVKLNADTT